MTDPALPVGLEALLRSLRERAKVEDPAQYEAGYVAEYPPEVTWAELGEVSALLTEAADALEAVLSAEPRPQDYWAAQAQTLARKIREAAGTMQANPATTIDDDLALLRSLREATEPRQQPTYEPVEDTSATYPKIDSDSAMATLGAERLTAPVKRPDPTRDLLRELYTIVTHECPSLLKEDSGGDSELDLMIASVLGLSREEEHD